MYIFPGTLEHLQKKTLKAFKTNAFSRSGKTEKRWNKMEQKVEHCSSVIRCQDPPPGDLPPGTGSSCSRILRLAPGAAAGRSYSKYIYITVSYRKIIITVTGRYIVKQALQEFVTEVTEKNI